MMFECESPEYEVYHNLVGTSFAALPSWACNWAAVDKTLMNIADINMDGIGQLAEIVIGGPDCAGDAENSRAAIRDLGAGGGGWSGRGAFHG